MAILHFKSNDMNHIDNFETAIIAGGCFWCTEAVFNRLDGVVEVTSGYTDGFIKNPAYREVCSGRTGHTEAIKIIFNPQVITFTELLVIFFSTHDPTTLNRQGNDVGTQYRSGIYYTSEKQKNQAESAIKQLTEDKVFEAPIVTEVKPFDVFYNAEIEHKDYYDNHRSQSYCQFIIDPKIKKLNVYFSDKLKN